MYKTRDKKEQKKIDSTVERRGKGMQEKQVAKCI